jgi:hypothetical protein
MRATPQSSQAIPAYLAGVVLASSVAAIAVFGGSGLWPSPLAITLPAMVFGSGVVPFVGALPFVFLGVLIATLVSLSAAYFLVSWQYGVTFQGLRYTLLAVGANIAFAGVCTWLCLRALGKRRTFVWRYSATLMPCVWLAYCAFPYLGEPI